MTFKLPRENIFWWTIVVVVMMGVEGWRCHIDRVVGGGSNFTNINLENGPRHDFQ